MKPRPPVRSAALGLLLPVLFASSARAAPERTLYAVTYPEGRAVDIVLEPTNRATKNALADGKVTWAKDTARISLRIRGSEPAVLFGGDITCYVAWTVTPDGSVENLGELPVQGGGGSATFRATRNVFAMILTAEAHPAVLAPSPMVVATSTGAESKYARIQPFAFSDFAKEPPRTDFESIANLKWLGKENPLFVQAHRILDVATRAGAERYAAGLLGEARQLLAQAEGSKKPGGGGRQALDFAQRSIAKSAAAIADTQKARADEASRPATRSAPAVRAAPPAPPASEPR